MIQLYREKNTLIKNFTIYGERHSGTNFLEQIVKSCLGLPVTWEFGWKHFFGFAPVNQLYNAKNTLFIGIVRNPYDWIQSMSIVPHHIPNNNKRRIEKLINNEWYSVQHESDREIMQDRNYITFERYHNIYDMRKHKLKYLYDIMPNIVSNYLLITYDDLIKNVNFYLKTISKRYNLYLSHTDVFVESKNPYFLESSIIEHINKSTDWDEEYKFYFTQRQA